MGAVLFFIYKKKINLFFLFSFLGYLGRAVGVSGGATRDALGLADVTGCAVGRGNKIVASRARAADALLVIILCEGTKGKMLGGKKKKNQILFHENNNSFSVTLQTETMLCSHSRM